MLDTSIAYRQHFRNSSAALIEAELTLNDDTVIRLVNNDFMENSCKFSSDSCDSTFTIGGAVASSFEFSLYNEDGRWDGILDKLKKARIKPYIGYGSVRQTDEPVRMIFKDESDNNTGVIFWDDSRPIDEIVNLTRDIDGNILFDENGKPMCYTVTYTLSDESHQKGLYFIETAETTGDIVKCKGLDALSLLEYPFEDFVNYQKNSVPTSWSIPIVGWDDNGNTIQYTTYAPIKGLQDSPYAGPMSLVLTIFHKTKSLELPDGEIYSHLYDSSLWDLTRNYEKHYACLYPANFYTKYDYPTNPYGLLSSPRELLPRSKAEDYANVTCLDICRYVGQLYGCFITTDNRGRITFKKYDTSAFDELNFLDGGKFDKGYPVDINEYESGDNADGGRFRCWGAGDSLEGGRFKTDPTVNESKADDGQFSSQNSLNVNGGSFDTNLNHEDCDNGWCKGYEHNEEEWFPNDRKFVICDDYSSITIDVEGTTIENVAVSPVQQEEVLDLSPEAGQKEPYHMVEFMPSKNTYIATSSDDITGATISVANNILIQGMTVHPHDCLLSPRGFFDDYRHTGKNIAERLLAEYKGMTLYSFNITTFGDPTIEVGDPILIIDRHNRTYKTYITHITYTVNGGATLSTTAPNEYTESRYITPATYDDYLQQVLNEGRESYSKNELTKLFKEGDTLTVSYGDNPKNYLGGNWSRVSGNTWRREREGGAYTH